jgi:hypothetical protein
MTSEPRQRRNRVNQKPNVLRLPSLLGTLAPGLPFPDYSPIAQFKTLQDLSQAPLNSRIIFGRLRVDHGLLGHNRIVSGWPIITGQFFESQP